MSLFPSIFLGLVQEKFSEAIASPEPCVSMEQAVGRLEVELHRLVSELTKSVSQQNSENLLEALVAIALTCARCAEDIVLPNVEEEGD